MKRRDEIPFVWDASLPAGACFKDLNGIWHIGEGTDISSFLFEQNLSAKDRDFLRILKIGAD
jgi:hypothetical protein